MAKRRETLNRRKFLFNSAYFLAGSLFGLNCFSRAFALEEYKMALIIDDIGYSLHRARQFLELGVPITFSILPGLTKSHDLALQIHRNGHEIMLHQPMEPYNPALDPGPGALYVGDGAKKIFRIVEENFSSVPFAIGVNNHMGSRLTSRQKEMKDVLRVIRERNLFFVDSLTSSRSMAYRTAKRLHITSACRNIFLDNRLDESAILTQLHKLKKHALKYNCAIGIGHPFPETAKAIGRFQKSLKGSGVSLVHVSRVLHS